MNRGVFLDRDGVINRDVGFCRRPEDFELLPEVAEALRLLAAMGFKIIVLTNQSGIARGFFTIETLNLIHEKMKEELSREGAFIDGIYVCPHLPGDGCRCHKPEPLLAIQAIEEHDIDSARSYVIGDTGSDVAVARYLGCLAINIGGEKVFRGPEQRADFSVPNLLDAVKIIRRKTVIMITGARGCGKSTVRKIFEDAGFTGKEMESAYLKYGEKYPGKFIQDMPQLIDELYLNTTKDVLKACGDGPVVFEATGTNKRWLALKEKVSCYHDVVVVKVDCPIDLARERMDRRGWENNYRSSPEETQAIASKSANIECDFVVDNSGSIENLETQVKFILECLSGRN